MEAYPTGFRSQLYPVARAATIGALSIAFGLIELRQALWQGKLSRPPSYDDNVYLYDALSRLEALFSGSLPDFLQRMVEQPLHAPISFLYAALGFLAFGLHDWAPYVVTFVGVAVVLGLIEHFGRGLPWWARGAVLLSALSWTFMGHVVIELRPDPFWGIALAGAACLLLSSGFLAGERATVFAAGALAGLALLAKPSISPVTAMVIAVALALASWLRSRAGALAGLRRDWLRFLLPALIIAGPHFWVARHEIWDYIHTVVFAENAKVWLLHAPMSRREVLLYYLAGDAGDSLVGAWLWGTGIIGAVAGILAWRAADEIALRTGFFLALVALLMHATITIPEVKNPYFGSALAAMLLFLYARAAFYVFRHLIEGGRKPTRPGALALAAGLILSAALLFRWPSYVDAAAGRTEHRLLGQILNYLKRDVRDSMNVFVTGATIAINAITLQYVARKAHVRNVLFFDLLRTSDFTIIERGLGVADYVIAFSDGYPKLVPLLASTAMQAALRERLDRDADFARLTDLDDGAAGGSLRIYGRGPDFAGLVEPENLGPVESLPIMLEKPRTVPMHVRWGLGPATAAHVRVPESGRLRLEMWARAPIAPRHVRVEFAGRTVANLDFPHSADFHKHTLELQAPAGDQRLVLAYDDWNRDGALDSRRLALLYGRLRISALP